MRLPRTRLAAYVDALLIVFICLLFAPRMTGLSLHEWLGVLLILPLLLHLLLSWTWIASASRTFVVVERPRNRVNYVLNWILFALVVLEVASGLMISHVVLPPLGLPTLDDRAWRAFHNQLLNWTHLVLGLHVAMNWKPLLLALRRYLSWAPNEQS